MQHLTTASRFAKGVGLVALAAAAAGSAFAQSAASRRFFLVGSEIGIGGSTASSRFRIVATLGSGVAATASASSRHRLLGGLTAATQAPATGTPWLTGVQPSHGPLLGNTAHTLFGTELDLSAAVSVQVGGRAATIGSRSNNAVTITLPTQTAPGWQPVTLQNSGGTATLPRGLGVLPLLDRPHAIRNGKPFRITYHGNQGDLVYLAVAGGRFPFSVKIPPYHHGLELNVTLLIDVVGPFPVIDPSGQFHLDVPGVVLPRPLFVQMLGLGHPGYAPGCFTNVLEL